VLILVLLAAGLVLPAPAAAAERWQWPLEPHLLRPFHTVADRFARGQHRGIDLGASVGTPVRSACPGVVRFAGTVGSAGRTVSVACGPLVATYLHLDTLAVRAGRSVSAGAPLGAVGRSGSPRDLRPHVHLGARVAATGRYVDPLGLMRGARRATPPPGLVPAPRRAPPPLAPPRLRPQPAPLRARPRVGAPAPVSQPRPGRPRVPAPPPLRAPGLVPLPVGASTAATPASATPVLAWFGLALLAVATPLGALARRRRRREGAGVVRLSAGRLVRR